MAVACLALEFESARAVGDCEASAGDGGERDEGTVAPFVGVFGDEFEQFGVNDVDPFVGNNFDENLVAGRGSGPDEDKEVE